MSDATHPEELSGDDLLAAEYALGLLEGQELLSAKARLAREPEFADAVAHWDARFAPLLDAIGGAEPGEDLWQRIWAELQSREAEGGAKVVAIEPQLRRWKIATALSSAAAAVLLAVVLWPQSQAPSAPGAVAEPTLAQAPLVANVPIEGTPLRLDLTYLPENQSLLVTAIGLTPDGVHDHELWLVPPEGELISLGVVTPGEVRAHEVPDSAAQFMASGAGLLLTREPLGGKPEGQDAGPVVAESAFKTI